MGAGWGGAGDGDGVVDGGAEVRVRNFVSADLFRIVSVYTCCISYLSLDSYLVLDLDDDGDPESSVIMDFLEVRST